MVYNQTQHCLTSIGGSSAGDVLKTLPGGAESQVSRSAVQSSLPVPYDSRLVVGGKHLDALLTTPQEDPIWSACRERLGVSATQVNKSSTAKPPCHNFRGRKKRLQQIPERGTHWTQPPTCRTSCSLVAVTAAEGILSQQQQAMEGIQRSSRRGKRSPPSKKR